MFQVLCAERGAYERFMRENCAETCQFYDQTIDRGVGDRCVDAFGAACASVRATCFEPAYAPVMRSQCRQTCGLCNEPSAAATISPADVAQLVATPPPLGSLPTHEFCVDLASNCRTYLRRCNDAMYAVALSRICAATCGFCSACEDTVE